MCCLYIIANYSCKIWYPFRSKPIKISASFGIKTWYPTGFFGSQNSLWPCSVSLLHAFSWTVLQLNLLLFSSITGCLTIMYIRFKLVWAAWLMPHDKLCPATLTRNLKNLLLPRAMDVVCITWINDYWLRKMSCGRTRFWQALVCMPTNCVWRKN